MSRQDEPTAGLGLGDYSSSDSETEYQEPPQSGKRGRSPREKGNEEAEKLKRVTSSGTSVSMSKQMERQRGGNENAVKLPSVDELLEGKSAGTAAAVTGGPKQEKSVALMAPPHVRMKVPNIVTEDQFALGRKR